MTTVSQEWQVICDGLRGRGRHLLETGLWSDCELTVGAGETKTTFQLHKTILAMASPVFAAKFFKGQKHPSLTDVKPDIFKQLLRYIYTDECRVDSVEAACSLARLAYQFTVQPPIKACVIFLGANIEVDNVLQILETAESIKDSDLSGKALRIICTETNRVLTHQSLLSVEVDTLSLIFKQIALNIESEMELVSAALKYSRVHPTCSLRNAVRYIRLLNLTQHEFSQVLPEISCLTSDESLLILRKLISPTENITMPHGFSTIKTERIKISRDAADNLGPEESINIVDEIYMQNIGYENIIEDLKMELNTYKLKTQEIINKFESEENTAKAKIDKLVKENDILKTKNGALENKTVKLNCEIDSSTWRCTRTIERMSNIDVESIRRVVDYIRLNEDATLCGIQLPTQVSKNSARELYEENIKICIFRMHQPLSTFSVQRRVIYNSQWDVRLNTPVKLEKNMKYEIRVEPLVPGRYPAAASAVGQTDSAGPLQQPQQLKVTWLRNEPVWLAASTLSALTAPSLVRALLFEK